MVDYHPALADDHHWHTVTLQTLKYVEVNILQEDTHTQPL